VLGDLNRRIFFWPGSIHAPIPHGIRHFQRYLEQEPVVVRVGFDHLMTGNSGRPPQFCRFNSGSPRHSGAKPSPRGPDTFLPATDFPGTPGEVIEVTFLDAVALPDHTEFLPLDASMEIPRDFVDGWKPLFHQP
jgi:hypothetical protein